MSQLPKAAETVLTETMQTMRSRGESQWIAQALADGWDDEVMEILEATLASQVTDSLSERATLDRLLNGRLARLRTKIEERGGDR